ncbi:MAG: dephospho-CoA kinase [Verrucomicrobiales bacterium]|nr:dephospho-CoA kinase [Verrucomicrobiales bacterium]
MLTIAITGGIACGKSTVSKMLTAACPAGAGASFDCDAAVAEIYEDPHVVERVAMLEPDMDLNVNGDLNRKLLRQRAFESSEFREKLEAILHPLVLKQAREFADSVSDGVKILFVEVPLLYEADFPLEREVELVVASSQESQINRLSSSRNIERELALQIIKSQMPLEEKMKRADIVIWNDGSNKAAESQVRHLIERCNPLFAV